MPCASFAAAMFAVQGVLAALHRRRETGLGQRVSVSLLASLLPYDMVQWVQPQISGLDAQTAGRAGQKGVYNQPGASTRQTASVAAAASPASETSRAYNPQQIHRPGFRVPRPNYMTAVTKDGVWLQLANTADHLWLAQMQAMDLVELYGEERFAKMPSVGTEADSEALWELVLQRARTRSYAEWRAIFDRIDRLEK